MITYLSLYSNGTLVNFFSRPFLIRHNWTEIRTPLRLIDPRNSSRDLSKSETPHPPLPRPYE